MIGGAPSKTEHLDYVEERYVDFMVLPDWALGLTAGSKAELQRGNTEPIPDALG
ncbi:hypothetical protein [Streptomyces sp. PTD5-9]|uniref:hypothetical protein n=1 Tax=Streptomyces sp. PTD5-9 TaxID=3120150 RepID=UPI003007F6A2